MAELVVSALLTVVFEKIASAVLTKVGGSKKVRSDLQKWEKSLHQIRNLLNDASQKEISDANVKDWLNHLQHLAYDIDDILDSLATDHAMHPELTEAGGITSKVKKLIPIPTCCTATTSSSSTTTEMHGKLNDITTKLQELYDESTKRSQETSLLSPGLSLKAGKPESTKRSQETSLLSPGIVGREDEKQNLVQKLLADNEPCDQYNFSIVPIVGMGGVGKTTLAKLLYNEPKVKEHFDIKAWVCVSDEFSCLNIGNVIFQSIAGEEKKDKEFKDLNLLQEALINELARKKFLLVLDDVWSEKIEDWDTLVLPFHAVAPGSKIIITTRKTKLIQHLKYGNPNANPFNLKNLSDDHSLSLFARYAYNFDSDPSLRPLGEAIVKKCKGLPLALKALGRSLSTKTNEDEWKYVLESEIWDLEDDSVLPALKLSYLDLPAHLKLLFAYTCLFPKDYVFEKEDLIWLWMAEGFLHETKKKSMERLGEEHFNELLSRSFFEYVDNHKSLLLGYVHVLSMSGNEWAYGART